MAVIDTRAADFFRCLSAEETGFFFELYEKAMELKLKVKKDATKTPCVSFLMGKNLVMRFINNGKRNYIKLKYYNCSEPGEVLERALLRTIEEHDFRYTGCYGCGSCQGKRRGYTIRHGNLKTYFRCGRELIEVYEINENSMPEILDALVGQVGSIC